jgi:hypothetical protein
MLHTEVSRMTMQQTPKQQSLFPDLPREQPLVGKDGLINPYWALFFDNLVLALQNNFNPEGILVPMQTAANIVLLAAGTAPSPPTGAAIRTSIANILYDSTNDEFKGNIAGTWKTFTLT